MNYEAIQKYVNRAGRRSELGKALIELVNAVEAVQDVGTRLHGIANISLKVTEDRLEEIEARGDFVEAVWVERRCLDTICSTAEALLYDTDVELERLDERFFEIMDTND